MIEEWQSCPACSGLWMRNYVYRHAVNACTIGAAEDSRQYADHMDGRRTCDRPATPAEITLAEHVSGYPVPVDSMTRVTRLTGGIFHRVIGGVDVPERSEVTL